MTTESVTVSANVMSELYFQNLRRLGLLERFQEVPFAMQHRKTGFSSAARCLSLLASQAHGCSTLSDWSLPLRDDSRLQHWMGDRRAPHASTLSRTLSAADPSTIKALRGILSDLSDQAWGLQPTVGGRMIVDVDNKGLPAQGATYEGTQPGYMADGSKKRGYRLHLLSIGNQWPMEMEFTAANAPAVPAAMVMIKRLMHRCSSPLRGQILFRGDSAHGTVRFVRFVQRYPCDYLLKGNNPATAAKLWNDHLDMPWERIVRDEGPDLLAMDLGPTRLDGIQHDQDAQGKEHRHRCHVQVPRVVVYRQDPKHGSDEPECFFLITTLGAEDYPTGPLLELYNQRGGDVENVFWQLDQAFEITHLRSRTFHGNQAFLLLTLIAATLTQTIRQEALHSELPVPAGLKETLVAARDCGLRLEHAPSTGCVLSGGLESSYTTTFRNVLHGSYQYRFRYAA